MRQSLSVFYLSICRLDKLRKLWTDFHEVLWGVAHGPKRNWTEFGGDQESFRITIQVSIVLPPSECNESCVYDPDPYSGTLDLDCHRNLVVILVGLWTTTLRSSKNFIEIVTWCPVSYWWSILNVFQENVQSSVFPVFLRKFHQYALYARYVSLNWCKFLFNALTLALNSTLHCPYFVIIWRIVIYNNIVCFYSQTQEMHLKLNII